jgi:hypothetical protein
LKMCFGLMLTNITMFSKRPNFAKRPLNPALLFAGHAFQSINPVLL